VRCEALQASLDAPRTVTPAELAAWLPDEALTFTVVDGRFHHLGRLDWPGEWRLELGSIDDAWQASTSEVPALWAAQGTCHQVLRVRGAVAAPLTVLNAVTGGASGWTLDVDLAPGSQLHLRIVHAAVGRGRSALRLAFRLGQGARLTIEERQATSAALLFAHADLHLAADATATWTSAWTGGDLVRQRLDATLAGRGATFDLAALADTAGDGQAHVVTRVRHAVGDTVSRQLVKTVLADRSRTSLDGIIIVDPGADGTDAELQNRNLVLSPTARADTRPQLDIRADEVKAAHGATIGRLDADEVLYLRMRGFSEAEATALLGRGWRDEVLSRLSG